MAPMKTIRLNLEVSLPDDARVLDVTALLAAWKFVLRGFFPQASVKTGLPLPERTTKTETTSHPTFQ